MVSGESASSAALEVKFFHKWLALRVIWNRCQDLCQSTYISSYFSNIIEAMNNKLPIYVDISVSASTSSPSEKEKQREYEEAAIP